MVAFMTSLRLPNPLQNNAIATPNRPVLWWRDRQWTASELVDAVARRAGGLASRGLTSDQRVGVVGEGPDNWVLQLHALWWLGVEPVLVDPKLPPARRDEVFERAGVTAVVEVETSDGSSIAPVPWSSERLLAMLATSGSTGQPKLVPVKTGPMLYAVASGVFRLGHHLDDVWLMCLPPWHIGGLSIVVRTAWAGTGLVWQVPFRADELDRKVEASRVTQVSLTPQMLDQWVDVRAGRRFPKRLRWALVGGAATSESILMRAEELGLTVLPTWGMTESMAQVVTTPPGDRRAGSVGPALPLVSIDVSEAGLLRIDGPQVDGSLETRDLGEIRVDGWVEVQGRADRQFKSGGKLVSPDRVEQVLSSHAAVASVVAMSVPHQRWGDALLVWIVVRSSGAIPSLAGWLQTRLAPHERPKFWVYDSKPISAGLKLTATDRVHLLERLRATVFVDEAGVRVPIVGGEPTEVPGGIYVIDRALVGLVSSLHSDEVSIWVAESA